MDGHQTGYPQGSGEQNPAYRPTHRHYQPDHGFGLGASRFGCRSGKERPNLHPETISVAISGASSSFGDRFVPQSFSDELGQLGPWSRRGGGPVALRQASTRSHRPGLRRLPRRSPRPSPRSAIFGTRSGAWASYQEDPGRSSGNRSGLRRTACPLVVVPRIGHPTQRPAGLLHGHRAVHRRLESVACLPLQPSRTEFADSDQPPSEPEFSDDFLTGKRPIGLPASDYRIELDRTDPGAVIEGAPLAYAFSDY